MSLPPPKLVIPADRGSPGTGTSSSSSSRRGDGSPSPGDNRNKVVELQTTGSQNSLLIDDDDTFRNVQAPKRSKSQGTTSFTRVASGERRLYSMQQGYTSNEVVQQGEGYTVIVYHKSMEKLAKAVQSLYPGKIHLIGPTFEYFKDGWPNVAFTPENVYRMQDDHASVCFLASFHTPEKVFEQLAVIYALPKMLVRNYRIIVPWFSTGTMERVETMGQIATAKTLARVLDSTPNCRTGAPIITIYDIHTLQEQFYFNDNVLVELKSAVFLLKQELSRMLKSGSSPSVNKQVVEPFAGEEIAIAFPDDGAKKRFGSKFPEYPHVVITKQRGEGDKRICRIQDGDAKNRHVILVDDMVQTGGTLLESIDALVHAGASKVSCYVTHAVFPSESWRRFLNVDKLDTFYVCDTIPSTRDTLEKIGKPFKILSIAPLLGYLLVGREPGKFKMRDEDKLDT
ncbi:unnamed protein product [Amoebophrya sp. A120]|nr:unnamed protein product [Amoebophrya sp. A120]|eukprot:GSA120T00002221001.1